MAIPKQDLIWAKKQKPSVMTLWLECWECDPYGTRWMTLNHSLSQSAFTRAKKILSNKGLFIFKPDRSIRDGRETVSWLVQNLHGARRKNFGLELNDSDKSSNDSDKSSNDSDKSIDALCRASIAPESTENQPIPAPSITPQQHLNNSSKELLKVSYGETQDLDDRGIAPEEQPASVQSCEESVDEQKKAPETEEKISDPWMSPEKNAISPTEKAILDEQTTEEYQRASREKAAELKAILKGVKEKNRLKREARLKGESELEEKKIE